MEKIIRVGTDCSGIEAPIQALLQMKQAFSHEFSSDIDKYVIKNIKANYEPKRIYGDKEGDYPDGDISNRKSNTLPDIDLYVCGFPCTTFSQAGNREGFKDKKGQVFWTCLEVIKTKRPKYFLLENVKGLLHHDKKRSWKIIWGEIQKLKEIGYYVYNKILNTRDYGIPQNRERVYIVGSLSPGFKWPEKCEMKKIEEYIDKDKVGNKKMTKKQEEQVKRVLKHNDKSVFIDFGYPKNLYTRSYMYCPTVTATCRNVYCIPMNRRANIKELLALQGFSKNFKQDTSDTQLKKQIGNSMSVNVIKKILEKLLYL